jgi:hypothetical protein
MAGEHRNLAWYLGRFPWFVLHQSDIFWAVGRANRAAKDRNSHTQLGLLHPSAAKRESHAPQTSPERGSSIRKCACLYELISRSLSSNFEKDLWVAVSFKGLPNKTDKMRQSFQVRVIVWQTLVISRSGCLWLDHLGFTLAARISEWAPRLEGATILDPIWIRRDLAWQIRPVSRITGWRLPKTGVDSAE